VAFNLSFHSLPNTSLNEHQFKQSELLKSVFIYAFKLTVFNIAFSMGVLRGEKSIPLGR